MNEPAFVPCRVAHWASAAPDGIALRSEAGQVTWAEGLALAVHHVAETFGDRPLHLVGYGVAADDPAFDEYGHETRSILEGALDDGIDLRGAWWEPELDPEHPPRRPVAG